MCWFPLSGEGRGRRGRRPAHAGRPDPGRERGGHEELHSGIRSRSPEGTHRHTHRHTHRQRQADRHTHGQAHTHRQAFYCVTLYRQLKITQANRDKQTDATETEK